MKKFLLALLFSLVLCFAFDSESVYAYTLTFQDYPDVEIDTYATVEYDDDNEVFVYRFYIEYIGCSVNSSIPIYWAKCENMFSAPEEFTYLCNQTSGSYKAYGTDTGTLYRWTIVYESDELLYDASGEFKFYVKLGLQLGSVSWEYYFLELTLDEPIPDGFDAPTPSVTPTPTPTPKPTATPTPKPTATPTPTSTPTPTPTPTSTVGPVLELDVVPGVSSINIDCYTGGMDSVRTQVYIYWAVDGEISEETSVLWQTYEYVDGAASFLYKEEFDPYALYYVKLVYTWQDDGAEYSKAITSELFEVHDYDVNSEIVLDLDYKANGLSVSYDAFTGGATNPSYTLIEIYWGSDGSDSSYGNSMILDTIEYIDGSYSDVLDNLMDGEWYAIRLIFEWSEDGEIKYKTTGTGFFQVHNVVVAPDDKNIVIYNFHSLMSWLWDCVFAIEFEYEGFTVSFQDIFIFTLVVPLMIGSLFLAYGFVSSHSDSSGKSDVHENKKSSSRKKK